MNTGNELRCASLNSGTSIVSNSTDRLNSILVEYELLCVNSFVQEAGFSVFSAGALLVVPIASHLSDRYGRRRIFLISMYSSVIFNFVIAFSPNYAIFVLLRFFVGAASDTYLTIGSILCYETVAGSFREWTSLFGVTFWLLGYLYIGVLELFIKNWRKLYFASAIPGLLTIVYIWLLPESPHWMISHKRICGIQDYVKISSWFNNVEIDLNKCQSESGHMKLREKFKERTMCDLFKYKRILYFLFVNGYITMTMNFYYFAVSFDSINLTENVFMGYILSGLSEIPGSIIVIPLLHFFGRRPITCVSFFLQASTALIIALVRGIQWARISCSFFGRMINEIAFATHPLLANEMMPTTIRTISYSIINIPQSIGIMFSPLLKYTIMDGCRKALYNYSWKQSPINKRRRVNPPEEEKKIFDDWFKEKADEYFPCIGDQDPDDEIVYANNSWMTSSPPCNPEMYGTLACISPMILERLQRPKHDQKIVKKEMNKCLANLNRYERSLKETRKTFDLIKKEKRRNLVFFQTEQLSGSVIFPEHSTCIASDEFSSFRKKLYKEQITTRMEGSLSGSKELISKLKSDSILFARRTSCHDTEVCTEQTVSSESKQQTSQHRSDDDSDDELLRLVLESSPIQKSDSTLRVALNEDELSDEALLSMMISSPVSSPKFKSNKWSSAVEITQTLINEMNRVEVQLDHNTRNFIESQRFTNLQISPISVDSGVSTGRNISLNHSADTNLSVGLNSAVRISPTVRNIHENTEDENKENICPNLQDRHADAAIFFSDNLDLLPEQRNNVVNVGNLLRLFSRSILDNEHENHDEHEREASTSPLSVQQRSSLSSSVTSRSPLHWPNFWPQFGSHPITGTPRHSPIRRRTRRLMEEPEFVSLEDLPEVNPFGPNGTPPRTPSRESFVEIRDDFGNRNSNELINEQRESECAVLEIASMALSTDFVTPPSKPSIPPMTPRKKKVNRKSLKTADSPSFFPKTINSSSFFPKKSCTVRHMLLKERRLLHPSTNSSMLSMVLRSATKPRRSIRIKKMPNRYSCNIRHYVDLRKKKKKRNLLKERFARKIRATNNKLLRHIL